MRVKLLPVLSVVTCVAITAGCGSSSSDRPADGGTSLVEGCSTDAPSSVPEKKTYDAYPEMVIDQDKSYTATLETSCGTMTVALDAKTAPKAVNSFVFLVREGFFDGTTFHRVIRGFVLQGGSPDGTGTGNPGYRFEEEPPPSGTYRVGDLAMAKTPRPATSGSQFFIITGPQGAALPAEYSLFGHVTEGMDVAERIESVPTEPPDDAPRQNIYVYSVTIDES